MENKTAKYRFQYGSLYEYDKASNAYIHCFKLAGISTKKEAIAAYEEAVYAESCEDCSTAW